MLFRLEPTHCHRGPKPRPANKWIATEALKTGGDIVTMAHLLATATHRWPAGFMATSSTTLSTWQRRLDGRRAGLAIWDIWRNYGLTNVQSLACLYLWGDIKRRDDSGGSASTTPLIFAIVDRKDGKAGYSKHNRAEPSAEAVAAKRAGSPGR